MIVVIAASASDSAAIELLDAADCGRFHVEARGVDAEAVADALAQSGLGEFADEHAFIAPAGIRALAGALATEAWSADFERMLAYAGSKGWLDATGRIQAHVEYTAPG